jgi:hypothetical protein
MTPTGSPRRRSSVGQVSGGLSIKSTAVGIRHASGGGKAPADGPMAAKRKGRSRAVHHGRRDAMGLPGVRRGLSALDLDASSAAVAAAHTLCRTRHREGARSDGDPGNGGCGGGFGV